MKHSDVTRSVAIAGRVVRYHTFPQLRQQTVGEHSWRVATIYLQLFGLPRAEVLEYILKHDLGELFSGDVPFYAKRRVEGLKEIMDTAERMGLEELGLKMPELTAEEWKQFKISDLLEMYECGTIEGRMGNQYGGVVCENIMAALTLMLPLETVHQLFRKLWPKEIT